MSRLTQLRAWWHRWREEFYEDNPISWLAVAPYRAFYRATSMKILDEVAREMAQKQGEVEGAKLTAEMLTRLREQAPARSLSQPPPVWTVSRSECRWLIVLWWFPLIIAGIALHEDWHTLMRSFSTLMLIPPMFLVLAPLVQFHPFWGIPQVLVLVGLSWLMTRRAIARLSVFRRLREQSDTRSSDEDWE